MIYLGLMLVGFGLADLGHSIWPIRWLPESVAAAVVVVLGLAAQPDTLGGFVALLAAAAASFGWGSVVRIGFGRSMAWLPLLYGAASVTILVLAPVFARVGEVTPGGSGDLVAAAADPSVLDSFFAATGWSDRVTDSAASALLIIGVLLVQMSTGNVVVRLVLAATGTIDPRRGHDATTALKGGRLLGPMERLAIVGLGLAGLPTAAGLVIASKGVLRFPELQQRRDATDGPSIDEVTEYFLVGSFVSWGFALGSLGLVVIQLG